MPEIFSILPVATAEDLKDTVFLFETYADHLGHDLFYQNFPEELASLPAKYAPPQGALLIARGGKGERLGCVALRPLPEEGECEIKRMFVMPEARGKGLGRALAEAIIAEARNIGYDTVKLDTMPHLAAALSLYLDLGFVPVPAYYQGAVPGTLFFGRPL